MTTSSFLQVNVGRCTHAGVKTVNEDAVAVRVPSQQAQIDNKGICCVLSDGVSSAEAGQQASEQAVHDFVEDYYLAPDTWSVRHCAEKILSAINLSLFKKSHQFNSEQKGFLCTLVGVIFKSQTAHFVHVGDSRVYLLREQQLQQLTTDHSAMIAQGKRYLTRALGMDNNLHIDYGKQSLTVGDCYLLTSDGVHDFVSAAQLTELLAQSIDEQQIAEQIIAAAKAAHSDDNISCVVAKVHSIANESLDDFNTKLTRLPFPPPLSTGMKLDGFRVEQELFASARSQLYLVTDVETQQQCVMKTPSVNYCDDTAYIDRFIQEEWIGKRLNNTHIVKVLKQHRARTCLYYLMEYVPGIGLDAWIQQHPFPTPKLAISIIKQIADGLAGFYEKETIHQDLKPANILIDQANNIKIVDFGSTFVAGTAERYNPIKHEGALGTASYSDPQYLLGKNTGIQGDLYALATISYELFTGKLPYGNEVEECQTAFDYDRLRYVSASYHNPVIPIWFDRALEKGVQINTEKRYQTMQQFITDLTNPNPDFLHNVPETQQAKSKMLFWAILSGFWLFMFALVFLLFKA